MPTHITHVGPMAVRVGGGREAYMRAYARGRRAYRASQIILSACKTVEEPSGPLTAPPVSPAAWAHPGRAHLLAESIRSSPASRAPGLVRAQHLGAMTFPPSVIRVRLSRPTFEPPTKWARTSLLAGWRKSGTMPGMEA